MDVRTVNETLRALATEDGFKTVEKRLPHGGSLQARRQVDGQIVWFWRASHAGKTFRERIGVADLSAPPKALKPTAKGYGPLAAFKASEKLAADHDAHVGGLQGLKADQADAEARKQHERATRADRSLKALLTVYVDHLKKLERSSAYDVRNIFDLHVVAPFPRIAAKAAADVTVDDVVMIQRRLIDAGKERTANKARAFLRAAFQCGADARVDAKLPAAFIGFGITINPVASTKRNATADRADKNPLTADELRTYWSRISGLQGLPGAVLRLHVLSGAQRIEQLLRLRAVDVRGDTLTLFDQKGRPGQGPRPHILPVTPHMAAALIALPQPTEGPYLITSTAGAVPLTAGAFGAYARAAVGDAIEAFQPKRLRSGVETLLSQHGVSRDVRAALQSHGQSGVQAKHYDAADHLPAKRAALDLLYTLITTSATPNVVPIRKRRRAAAKA